MSVDLFFWDMMHSEGVLIDLTFFFFFVFFIKFFCFNFCFFIIFYAF
jgi:hypothetical protein